MDNQQQSNNKSTSWVDLNRDILLIVPTGKIKLSNPELLSQSLDLLERAANTLDANDQHVDGKIKTLAQYAAKLSIGDTNTLHIVEAITRKTGLTKTAVKKVFADAVKGLKRAAGEDMSTPNDWEKIKVSESGEVASSVHNARAALLALKVELSHDLFTGSQCITSVGDLEECLSVGAITEDAVKTIQSEISKRCKVDVRVDVLLDAIGQLAISNKYDSLIDYYNQLPKWDGVERLDSWMDDYLGCGKNEYTQEAGAVLLMAMVARAYVPGAKFDHVLILEGAQGLGKSTLLRILAGNATWFTDEDLLKSGADASKRVVEVTRGKHLVEMGELAGLRKSQVEDVKAFVTRTEETARMAYAKSTVTVKRRFVAVGTTNEERYLQDRTGNRRFWPIMITEVNLQGFALVRDQLMAEAKVRFEAVRGDIEAAVEGKIVELYPLQLNSNEAREAALAAQTGKVAIDQGWAGVLEDIPKINIGVAGSYEYLTRESVAKVLGMMPKDFDNRAFRTAQMVLTEFGWEWTGKPMRTPDGRLTRAFTRKIA